MSPPSDWHPPEPRAWVSPCHLPLHRVLGRLDSAKPRECPMGLSPTESLPWLWVLRGAEGAAPHLEGS